MHYGNQPHTPSPQDIKVISCPCGWFSPEVLASEFGKRGVPWYCDDCGQRVSRFATFHPSERGEAYEFLIYMGKGESLDQLRCRLYRIVRERRTKGAPA